MSYETFSHYYDRVMDQSLYGKWLSFTERHLPAGRKLAILELACGTGNMAVSLAAQGHQVTGLDLSEEMLAVAYNRMLEAGVDISWLVGDMRRLEKIGSFDMVTCFSDSLCYLQDEKEMGAAFSGVADQLKENGLFLFDVHSLHQIDDIFPGYQYIYQDEDGAFLWESFAGQHPHSIEHDLTFYVRSAVNEELFERYTECHRERTFPLEVYRELLQEAGFREVQVTADFGAEEVTPDTARWFFVCRK